MRSFSRYKDTPKYVTDLAYTNRKNPTCQEAKLWEQLQGRKLYGKKFRRQFPIGRYIADFYNHDSKLVIEIDGGIHTKTAEYDHNRSEYLKSCGYVVVRFSNEEIETETYKVLETIKTYLHSPFGGRGALI